MTLAFNTIYRTNISALPATHKYVKFMPTLGNHLALLQEWEINTLTPLYDFPLQYEITTMGEYYVDPAVQDPAYTFQYASVPVNVSLPNVPHQIISELFIPPLNSYVAELAFYQVGENYEGDTLPHFNDNGGEGDGDDPADDCNPGCSNYPCCKLGWIDCNEYPCSVNDPFGPPPCLPGSPDWPKCLEIFPPDAPPDDPPAYDYCECTEYQQGHAVKTWKVQIPEGEDCSQYEQNWGVGSSIECTPGVNPPPPPVVLNECSCPIPTNPKIPAGCIRVDEDGIDVGVRQVMIKLKDTWFGGDITFTNDQGCWQLNESYAGKVWMWVQFENSNCKVRAMRKWYAWQALAIADDYVGHFENPPYNNIFVFYSNSSDNESLARRYWACAHTINSDYDYRIAASNDGIPIPRPQLNYFIKNGDGAAGAPLLQDNPYGSYAQLLIAMGIGPVLPAWTSPLYPDITNQYNVNERADNFKGSQAHELGHVSHYALVGESFWLPYRTHIVNNFIAGNGVYGSFGNFASGSDPDRVALGEALGNFTGAIYGGTADGGEFRDFNRLGDPSPENFIPRGLMWDLGDNLVDLVGDPNNPTIWGLDNISGFTPSMIYGALTPNVTSIRSFRDRLGTLSLNSTPNTSADYNRFVDIYDMFN